MTDGLLIAGGEADPCLPVLAAAARRLGLEPLLLLHGAGTEPAITWDLDADRLIVDGRDLAPAAVFLRYDVFGGRAPAGSLDRAAAWYATVQGWASAHPAVGQFNRELAAHGSVKPAELALARSLGLATPRTVITNHLAALQADRAFSPDAAIAKPVAGGSYVRRLDRVLAEFEDEGATAPMPAIVQECLAYPELRVFLVKGEAHVFEIRSRHIDYRPHLDNAMDYLGAPESLAPTLDKLRLLAGAIGCDFCACDLKSRPGETEPVFLEINTGPMFAAFDANSGGTLAEAMVRALLR